jgi:hypothetical protein
VAINDEHEGSSGRLARATAVHHLTRSAVHHLTRSESTPPHDMWSGDRHLSHL